MSTHNSYFEGRVQSIGFARNGRRMTVGVVEPGEVHFETGAAERMTVVSGALQVRIGGGEWQFQPAGTSFEIPEKTGFDMTAKQPAAYLCEFL